MNFELVIPFLWASMLLTIMPGPDNIFVLLESVTNGSRNGILIAVGLVIGVLVHTIIASTGLSLIIQQSNILFDIIKYTGAAYLFYLAFLAFFEKPYVQKEQTKKSNKQSILNLIRKGIMMNVLNPKVSLFFIAFLPQFVDNSQENLSIQMMILGFIFMIQALLIFSMISILAARLANYLKNDLFWKVTKFIKISVFCILGLFLIFSHK